MDRAQLQSHQLVLKFMGFYTGKCDGIWGPESVTAMRAYEASGKFSPGYPSNGMPFKEKGQLPANLYRVPRQPLIIKHVDMPDDYADKHKDELVVNTLSRTPCGKVIDCKKPTEVKVEVADKPVTEKAEQPVVDQKPVVRTSKLPG